MLPESTRHEENVPKITREESLQEAAISRNTEHKVISPSTFETLHRSFVSGRDSSLSPLFEPRGDLFFCQEEGCELDFKRTWIFDADDTLWEDNIHYEKIIADLTEHFISHGLTLDRKTIRKFIDDVEHEIIPQHGFGAKGFAISMQVVCERLKAQHIPGMPHPDAIMETIIPTLSNVPYEIPENTHRILAELRAKKTEALVLFTQGPIDIQLGKIARSGLAPLFHGLAVGKNKKKETYAELVNRFSHSKGEVIVVGNSINSEVLPAIALGYKAFHFRNPNSWHAVNTSTIPAEHYRPIDSLMELLPHTEEAPPATH